MAGKDSPAFSDAALFGQIGDFTRPYPASFVPGLGLHSVTLQEAAELVAVDMWFSSALPPIEGFDPESGLSPRDPALLAALSEVIEGLTQRLTTAIDSGRLKPVYPVRDLNERLVPTHTRIDLAELREWLSERGYVYGDVFDDRELLEQQITEYLAEVIDGLRAKASVNRDIRFGDDQEAELLDAHAEIARLRDQVRRLETGKQVHTDRPIGTRQRRTLLTIIAALCDEAKIDYRSRGAAQRVRELTESLGAPIDADTIRRHLGEIPDALDSRMK